MTKCVLKLLPELTIVCILLPKFSDLLWEKSDREKLLKFEAEGQEFAKILRALTINIQMEKNIGN